VGAQIYLSHAAVQPFPRTGGYSSPRASARRPPIKERIGNETVWDSTTDADLVRDEATALARNGAKEINLLTMAHGDPYGGYGMSGKVPVTSDGTPILRASLASFFAEDARTQGMIQEQFPGCTVNLFCAGDPAQFDAYEAKAAQARALTPGIYCIAGVCYSAELRK